MDVFRVLLQYARELKDHQYQRIILAAYGQKKFVVPGEYFQQLGREYDFRIRFTQSVLSRITCPRWTAKSHSLSPTAGCCGYLKKKWGSSTTLTSVGT